MCTRARTSGKYKGAPRMLSSSSSTGAEAEAQSLRSLAGKGTELARCLLAYFAIPSSCSPYFLITQGREGRRRRYGEGEGSQPSSQPGFRGVARVADRRGRRREGKARHFKIAFLLFEVRCRQQRKSSHIHTTDCGLRTTTNCHERGRWRASGGGMEFDHGYIPPGVVMGRSPLKGLRRVQIREIETLIDLSSGGRGREKEEWL